MTQKEDRYELRYGKLGPYFYDSNEGVDMYLEDVLEVLNAPIEITEQMKHDISRKVCDCINGDCDKREASYDALTYLEAALREGV